MNIKNLLLVMAIIIISFPFAESKENQKDKWKGKIFNDNGIEVIKNPNNPFYGNIDFDLIEDLSIGQENDDRYRFYKISDIKIDVDENIYVLDSGNIRIQKYDRFGKYLCTMGGKGQGPGEFQMPSLLLVDDHRGIIGVQDMMVLKLFDKKGKHLRDILFDSFPNPLALDASGYFWGIGRKEEDSDNGRTNVYKTLLRYSAEGKTYKKVFRIKHDIFIKKINDMTIGSGSGEEFNLIMSPLDGPGLVYGYSKEYMINLIDSEGNLLKTITKEEPYRHFTYDEKRQLKNTMIPEHKPFFYFLFTDSQGRIYVRRNNIRLFEDGERRFDIFGKEGQFLYTSAFSFHPFIIKNGFFYTQIINNDTGEIKVKRLKIKNWDQIKEKIL